MIAIPVAFFLGALTWSLLEYCIHRWLGHDARLRPNFFEEEHTRHHAHGDYFAPAWKKGSAAVLAFAATLVPAVLLVGVAPGLAYAAGLAGFYLFYEVVHRRAHTHAGFGAYGRWVRRHHFWHHFGDPRVNHGVTSPLWDIAFGTLRKPGVIVVPVKLAMPWLLDEATGDLREEFAGQYRLRGRRPAAEA
ncbi:MAG: hypothetical protein EA398_15590 [Deltaproteobacteria bacterium]|nr:MAG: hypothetical protein EA398_15590 [Deltaproteobacteria bacterium]